MENKGFIYDSFNLLIWKHAKEKWKREIKSIDKIIQVTVNILDNDNTRNKKERHLKL